MTESQKAFEEWWNSSAAVQLLKQDFNPIHIWEAAIEWEREACAKACEDEKFNDVSSECKEIYNKGCQACVERIRERGEL